MEVKDRKRKIIIEWKDINVVASGKDIWIALKEQFDLSGEWNKKDEEGIWESTAAIISESALIVAGKVRMG